MEYYKDNSVTFPRKHKWVIKASPENGSYHIVTPDEDCIIISLMPPSGSEVRRWQMSLEKEFDSGPDWEKKKLSCNRIGRYQGVVFETKKYWHNDPTRLLGKSYVFRQDEQAEGAVHVEISLKNSLERTISDFDWFFQELVVFAYEGGVIKNRIISNESRSFFTGNPVIIRVDFSSHTEWEVVQKTIASSISGSYGGIEFVDDPKYLDVTKEQLLAVIPASYHHSFIVAADHMTMVSDEHTLLVVDLTEKTENEFRVIPQCLDMLINNLSIGNMDIKDFVTVVDEDGVLRSL